MIAESQLEDFALYGLLKLEGVLSAAAVADMYDRVWRFIEKRDGMLRDDPTSWIGKKLSTIKGVANGKIFDAIISHEVLKAVHQLTEGRSASRREGTSRQLLVTFPNAANWTVPYRAWHYDLQQLPGGSGPPPGVQLFAFLNTVRPGGGGTVVVTGTHRLLKDLSYSMSPSAMKDHLGRKFDYFHKLFSKDDTNRQHFVDEPYRIGDVELQVVEMTGKPGDVMLMDMRLLHTQAPNSLDTPRMMLTERLLVEQPATAS